MADELDLRDIVKSRYALDTPRPGAKRPGPAFVWNVLFDGNEVPGMRAERVERTDLASVRGEIEAPRAASAAGTLPAWPLPAAHGQSIWRDVAGRDVVVRVDLFECGSTEDAEELVVWLLGEFEAPLAERKEGLGDVAFGAPGDHLLLFSRANLVYLLRNIGRRRGSVLPAATALEAHAVSVPDTTAARTGLAGAAGTDDADLVETVLADVGGGQGDERRTRKIVAPAGEVWMSGGRIMYRGPRAGLERVVIADIPAARRRPSE